MRVYKFKNCYLNSGERQIIKDGNYVKLAGKAYDVLEYLVRKSGEIVTKEEILDQVWSGSFVEEANLPVHISKLRGIFGKNKTEPFIGTVQGSGYRLISPVQIISGEEWREQLPSNNKAKGKKEPGKFTFDSIAVLPLQNENSRSDIDYLTDGLTESFINGLSLIPNLRVMARSTVFRYKNTETSVREIGRTLGVAAVLTGRVRFLKDHLMISVELVRVEDETQIWGTQFNQSFSDILDVQEKIISAVSEKLRSHIGSVLDSSLKTLFTPNFESCKFYLKGKFFMEKRSLSNIHKAVGFFQKSVSCDPTNAPAYIQMVESYILLYTFDHLSHSEALARIDPLLKILCEFDQSNDSMQVMHARINAYFYWNFEQAEKNLQRAIEINPNCIAAHYRYSNLLMMQGKFSEASKELQQIMLIDPFSVANYKRIGRLFYCMKHHENALVYLNEALELEPADYEAMLLSGAVLTELDRYDEAIKVLEKSLEINFNIESLSMLGYTNARAGRKTKTRQIIRQIKSESKKNQRNAIKIARIYAALGEKENACSFLEKAFAQHEVDLVALKLDPRWASIADEPKFKEIVGKVGFPKNQI